MSVNHCSQVLTDNVNTYQFDKGNFSLLCLRNTSIFRQGKILKKWQH